MVLQEIPLGNDTWWTITQHDGIENAHSWVLGRALLLAILNGAVCFAGDGTSGVTIAPMAVYGRGFGAMYPGTVWHPSAVPSRVHAGDGG